MSGFQKIKSSEAFAPVKRVALYLRVSTGRQAAGDVSIPSQRDLTTRYCQAQGWEVVTEFVEPGASATDDKRPVFQSMLEQAKNTDRSFDVICVHAFSRFYRNGAEMELTIRKLRKHGVEVVSVTQPTGTDPSQELMRQIIGIFDEYTSKENGKNVTRAMRESAKQGFWNGARPPLGYRVVEAERRGSKIKKKLDIDPVEAELVSLIFKLYTEGDGTTPPLGIKETTKWLNAKGYRTRLGAPFGVGTVHKILTHKYYASGKWPYGIRNAKTGATNDPAMVVEVDIPPILTQDVIDQANARLTQNNPHVTPPRVVNGPTLLTGLAVCAACGSGLTKSGTRRRGKIYSYYSCAGSKNRGTMICSGLHIPERRLDTLILENIKDRLLQPERITEILSHLIQRKNAQDQSVSNRRSALEKELTEKGEKLKRLYRAIEDGVVELDSDIAERIKTLKNERDLIHTTLERLSGTNGASSALTPERIETFTRLISEKLENGDVQARKAYLRSIILAIEVENERIRIIGEKSSLAAAVAGKATDHKKLRGFVRKWCGQEDSNLHGSPH